MNNINGNLELKRGRGKGLPLYKQISNHISGQIKTGILKEGDRLPPIVQMVRMWKVDYQTIYRVVKELEDNNLIHHATGRGKGTVIRKNSQYKYSIIFLRWSKRGYPLEIMEGIYNFAKEKGLDFSITEVSSLKDGMANTLSHPPGGTSGVIVLPKDSPAFRKACLSAQKKGVKIVFVDMKIEGLAVSSVSGDHCGGAHKATKHLLDLHGLPVYCIGAYTVSSIEERIQGWGLAMRNYGITEYESYLLEAIKPNFSSADYYQQNQESNYRVALDLLKRQAGKKISIFSCDGFASQGVYRAAEELGLQIGQDVYVAGFGDDPVCKKLKVPLTCIEQKWEDIGYEAANVLFLEMSGAMKHPMSRLLPAVLQIRQSSTSK